MKKKQQYNKVNVELTTYYCLNGEYILFAENPFNNNRYEDVDVLIKTEKEKICGVEYEQQVIQITGEEPIRCELLSCKMYEDTLYIKFCQDWG